jgi:hypothetical protein
MSDEAASACNSRNDQLLTSCAEIDRAAQGAVGDLAPAYACSPHHLSAPLRQLLVLLEEKINIL